MASLPLTGIVAEIVAIPGPLVTPKAAGVRAIAAALQKDAALITYQYA